MKVGKNTLKISTLYLMGFLLVVGCTSTQKEINLDGKWWFSFDVSSDSEVVCDFTNLTYTEVFISKKKDDFFLNFVYVSESRNGEFDVKIVATDNHRKFAITLSDEKNCGILEIKPSGEAIIEADCPFIPSKSKYLPISQNVKHDYWNFFGNRKKWDEEFICRETIHLKELVMSAIK